MYSRWLLALMTIWWMSSPMVHSTTMATSSYVHQPGSMNLFLNREEMRRLLGLSVDLFYIREGKVNDYALRFQVPIPANISVLLFTWQNLGNTPIPYSISMSVSDTQALGQPAINISREGVVPNKEQLFRIVLPCSSNRDAEVDVNIDFNLTLSPSQPLNVTTLTLKRKKICLKHTVSEDEDDDDDVVVPSSPPTVSQPPPNVDPSTTPIVLEGGSVTESSNIPSFQPVFLAVGCAFLLVFILTFIASLCYYKMSGKTRPETRASFYCDGSMKYPADSYLRSINSSTRKLSPTSKSLSRSGGIDGICSSNYLVPNYHQYPSRVTNDSSYLSLPRSTAHIYCEPDNERLSDPLSGMATGHRQNQKIDFGGPFGQTMDGIYMPEPDRFYTNGLPEAYLKTIDSASRHTTHNIYPSNPNLDSRLFYQPKQYFL